MRVSERERVSECRGGSDIRRVDYPTDLLQLAIVASDGYGAKADAGRCELLPWCLDALSESERESESESEYVCV